MSLVHRFVLILLALVASSRSLSLSGKVVDVEEGNGLKSVNVSLAVAGLRVISEKNGDWSLGAVGVGERIAPSGMRERDPAPPGWTSESAA